MHKTVIITGLLSLGLLGGCSSAPKEPAVASKIKQSLYQAGIKTVSVSQDRTKGVVTLEGHAMSDSDKARAAQIAQSMAGDQVVANEVAVLPQQNSGTTKTMYSDLDKGINENLDAALISSGFNKGVRHSVKNGVVTLTGSVDNQGERSQVESVAHNVPNVQQVVDEIQTTNTRATSN